MESPLEQTIDDWTWLSEGPLGRVKKNCPLCDAHGICNTCPIKEKTGRSGCRDTPYREWEDHLDEKHKGKGLKVICEECRRLVLKELEFLKTLRADPLEESIAKWQVIYDQGGADPEHMNCALCDKYNGPGANCEECPVCLKTGHSWCDNSPYKKWVEHRRAKHEYIHNGDTCAQCKVLAYDELNFLISLRPKPNVLEESIEKWQIVVNQNGTDNDRLGCALCDKYHEGESSCNNCPVKKKTGRALCYDTPYKEWHGHRVEVHGNIYVDGGCSTCKELAMKELEFLKSLRPESNDSLEKSIEKWRQIAFGDGEDSGTFNCALCKEYYDGGCSECPVLEKTNEIECYGTPFYAWQDHKRESHSERGGKAKCDKCRELAKKMYVFLTTLREKPQVWLCIHCKKRYDSYDVYEEHEKCCLERPTMRVVLKFKSCEECPFRDDNKCSVISTCFTVKLDLTQIPEKCPFKTKKFTCTHTRLASALKEAKENKNGNT